ncbi:MAG: hypothetical protein WAV09_00585 [Minisyncoccia bacterium]
MAKKTVIVGSTVSAQQLKDLFRQIGDGGITHKHMQAFLERRNPFTETEASPATFLTGDYFVSRHGRLWVSNEFVPRIISAYPEALVPRGLEGIESFDLTRDWSDKTIIDRFEMGGEENVRKHAFKPDQIAELIDRQPNGEPGRLLSNAGDNLFYVVGAGGVLFVVSVRRVGRCRWDVNAWRCSERGIWIAGGRVFRNTRTSSS